MGSERPIIVTIICCLEFFCLGVATLGFFILALLLVLFDSSGRYAQTISQTIPYGQWIIGIAAAVALFFLIIDWLIVVALWNMKRWALYAYTALRGLPICFAVSAGTLNAWTILEVLIIAALWTCFPQFDERNTGMSRVTCSPIPERERLRSRAVDELIFK